MNKALLLSRLVFASSFCLLGPNLTTENFTDQDVASVQNAAASLVGDAVTPEDGSEERA